MTGNAFYIEVPRIVDLTNMMQRGGHPSAPSDIGQCICDLVSDRRRRYPQLDELIISNYANIPNMGQEHFAALHEYLSRRLNPLGVMVVWQLADNL